MTKKLMLKQLASMLASFKRKKKYYCEVEYIESTEKDSFFPLSPIDSTIDSTTTWEVRLAFNDVSFTGQLMGYGYSGSNRYNLGIESNKFRFAYSTNWFDAGISTPDTNPHTWRLEPVDSKNANAYIDGQMASVTASTDFETRDWPICVGGRSTGSNQIQSATQFGWKLYYSKIWKAGRLALDVIPVLDWDMKPCLYDRISDNLIYATIRYVPSAGGEYANVTAGREIHYVDYLESTGTQYIDTGVYLTNNHSVEIDYQLTSTDLSIQARKGLYGGLVTSRHGALLSPTNRYLEAGYGEGNNYYQLGMPDTNRHVLYQKKNELYFDGALTYTFTTATFTQASTAPLGNFTYTNYNPASAKYYSSRWWDGNTLVRDYKPAIDENGICFWFDKVTHTCYLNAGTGDFLYPPVQTEYLETTAIGGCIDLGLKYKSSMSIECKYTRTQQGDSGSVLPLSNNTTNPLIYMPALNAGAFTDRFVWRRSGYSEQRVDKEFSGYPVTTEFKVDAINDVLYIDNAVAMTGMIAGMNGYTSPYQSDSNLYMLSINGTYSGLGKVYYLKLYDTTQVYRDLIPAWKDGQFGMYDKENNVLYQNIKTAGTIVSGKIIESEYLE